MDDVNSLDQLDTSKLRPRMEETWSFRRAQHRTDEKRLMAAYCAQHDFLVHEGHNPEMDPRETVASILVNQGTTPNIVVEEALKWIEKNQDRGPFDITWYTPGSLVPATLRHFRLENPHLSAATQLFLFPGRIDFQTESVTGPEAVAFAEQLERCFTYAILSTYSFDIESGIAYFHYSEETRLQRACARCYAAHKFLFLDSSKFKREGNAGYNVSDLLETAETVTIYTVSSPKDNWIKIKFESLAAKFIHDRKVVQTSVQNCHQLDMKSLRLRIVGRDEKPTSSRKHSVILTEGDRSCERRDTK